MINVKPSGQACGAVITGLDMSEPLSSDIISEIRQAWLEHHVLAFPEQQLTDEDLVRITDYFGSVGDDPYFVPISKKTPVVALTRRADEQALSVCGKLAYGLELQKTPAHWYLSLQLSRASRWGEHRFCQSADGLGADARRAAPAPRGQSRSAFGCRSLRPQGTYGEKDQGSDRSMKILFSDQANKSEPHPVIAKHPESGADTIFGTVGYIHTIEGMSQEDSQQLIMDLYAWQTREEFQYTHVWQPNMLVMWDNRSVLHRANGGYDGYDRELHRLTIAGNAALAL